MQKIDNNAITYTLDHIPIDVLKIILGHVPASQWPELKTVNRTFFRALQAIENANPLYNWVNYDEQFYQQDSVDTLKHIQPSLYPTFTFRTKKPLVAITQLGSKVTHQWAPLLTCDWQSTLRLYQLIPNPGKAVRVCTYTFHALAASGFRNPRLSAAISLGNNVVSADQNGFIAVWLPPALPAFAALRSKRPQPTTIRLYHEHTTEVTAIDCVNNTQFVTGDRLGTLKFWDIQQEKSTLTIDTKEPIRDLRILPQQKLLVLTSKTQNYCKLTVYQGNTATILLLCENYSTFNLGRCLPYDVMRILTPTVFIGCNLYFQPEHEQNLSTLDCTDKTQPQPTVHRGPLNPVWGMTCNFFSRSNHYCYAEEATKTTPEYIAGVTPIKKKGYRYNVVFCKTASELRPLLPEIKMLEENPPEQPDPNTMNH